MPSMGQPQLPGYSTAFATNAAASDLGLGGSSLTQQVKDEVDERKKKALRDQGNPQAMAVLDIFGSGA